MQPRPITYREEIIGPMLSSIVAGECCSIIGASGIGKSNMVQHMLRPDVLDYHLGDQAGLLRFVSFDTNLLATWSPCGFFEGLLEALLAALGSSLTQEIRQQLHTAQQLLLAASENYTLALRCSAEALAQLCTQWRIVLLFDEFDPLFAQLASSVLRNLRGLRDRYKYRLMYVTFSRQPLPGLRDTDDWDEIEPFVELLSLHEIGLRPLQDEDAMLEVERFANRHGQQLQRLTLNRVVALSGGHPALLRALTQCALQDEQMIEVQGKELYRVPTIHLECTKIWQQLTGDEQDELRRIGWEVHPKANAASVSRIKGLLRDQGGEVQVFSPVFAAYLLSLDTTTAQGAPPITVDTARHTILYYGRDISSELSPLEYQLLIYLWEHYGQICPLAEVARAIHPDEQQVYLHESSELERVRILARRLRRRLEALAPDQPVLFSVHRMRGLRLGLLSETMSAM